VARRSRLPGTAVQTPRRRRRRSAHAHRRALPKATDTRNPPPKVGPPEAGSRRRDPDSPDMATVIRRSEHMETIDRIECLACGQFRPPSTQQAECPLRGYLGWTLASALSEVKSQDVV